MPFMPCAAKSVSLFALRFVVIFGLLVFPWPGLRSAFAVFMRSELRLVLRPMLASRDVCVRPHRDPAHPSADTEVAVADPKDLLPDGNLPAKVLTLDSRSVGWMPQAMILSLCAATGLSRTRRWRLLLGGLAFTHALVLATFAVSVLPILVTEASPAWLFWLVNGAYHVLVENLWMAFVGPFLIWLLCLFVSSTGWRRMGGSRPGSQGVSQKPGEREPLSEPLSKSRFGIGTTKVATKVATKARRLTRVESAGKLGP